MDEELTVCLDVWLSWWGEGHQRSSDDVAYWLGIYAAFGVLDVIFITASIGYCLPFPLEALNAKIMTLGTSTSSLDLPVEEGFIQDC